MGKFFGNVLEKDCGVFDYSQGVSVRITHYGDRISCEVLNSETFKRGFLALENRSTSVQLAGNYSGGFSVNSVAQTIQILKHCRYEKVVYNDRLVLNQNEFLKLMIEHYGEV